MTAPTPELVLEVLRAHLGDWVVGPLDDPVTELRARGLPIEDRPDQRRGRRQYRLTSSGGWRCVVCGGYADAPLRASFALRVRFGMCPTDGLQMFTQKEVTHGAPVG